MPWIAHEPLPDVDRAVLFDTWERSYLDGADVIYGVFRDGEVIGGTGLHKRRGPNGLEIGYWIRADAIGQGLATEVAAVLTRAGVEKAGLERVDLSVDPENVRSLAIPRKLGYVEEGRLRRRLPPKEDGGPRRDQIMFSMLAE